MQKTGQKQDWPGPRTQKLAKTFKCFDKNQLLASVLSTSGEKMQQSLSQWWQYWHLEQDIWLEWWGDMIGPKKWQWQRPDKNTMTMIMAFREYPLRAIKETCDLRLDTWDTDYISDNWEQQYWQLHCDPWIKSDGESICNPCDIFLNALECSDTELWEFC